MLKKIFLYGGGAFLALIILGILVSPDDDNSAAPSTLAPGTLPATGIGVSRKEILDDLGDDFTFKTGTPINGEDNFVGNSPSGMGNTVQLVGPEDNLTRANMMAVMGGSKSTETAEHLGEFVRAIDVQAATWIQGVLKDVNYDADWKKMAVINGRKFDLSYSAIAGLPTFNVEVSRE